MSLDWSILLGREPNSPQEAPSSEEVALWFAWCVVGVFGSAGAVAGAVGLAVRVMGLRRPLTWTCLAFATTAFLLGLVGTTFASAWADTFVFTWPVSLYVAFRVTIALIVWVEAQPKEIRPRWASRLVTLLFLACCGGYYWLCHAVGYLMGLGFLAGFLPAAPAAMVAARTGKFWLKPVAESTAFTIYFWTSAMLPGWKDQFFG